MKQVKGIWLPDHDTHFAEHFDKNPIVDGKGTYQHAKYTAALQCVSRFNVAVDVGAHVGLWSRLMLLDFAAVDAFEPVPEHVECLRLNTADSADRINISHVAVGATNCYVHMITTPGNSGNACVDGAGKTPMVTLDSATPGPVDFVKIDVEGFEVDVLRGGEELLRASRPVILIEQKLGNAERYGFGRFEACELLESWGFHKLWNRSGDYCYGP